jgi:hypothetical protein
MEIKQEVPIFLGLSHKAARRGYGWELIGVTYMLFFPFFPQTLKGLQCLMGINKNIFYSTDKYCYKLWFTDENNPDNRAWADQEIGFQLIPPETASLSKAGEILPTESAPSEEGLNMAFNIGKAINRGDEFGAYEIIPILAPPLFLSAPTTVSVDIEWGSQTHRLGRFMCEFVEPPPLSEAEQRAIASRIGAFSAVLFSFGCNMCGDKLSIYALLNPEQYPSKKLERTATYISNAPEEWHCKCSKSFANLIYLKRGIHDLFRRSGFQLPDTLAETYTPLYEKGQIANISADFQALINSASQEEAIQKFIEKNPLVWAFLSPIKIIYKPPVLSKKKADFGILTAQKVLYLVEIEKPKTKLFTKKGGLSADLQKGIDQLRDWNVVIGNHRLAFLNEIDLKQDEVHDVRFILVAGLANQTPMENLIKLRMSPPMPNTQFFCFDEIVAFLNTLEGQLKSI